ncbi:uncharacterized protein DUF4254 [Nocardia tenerifensis]|uniref:Uncharacterized protein DUF4254 n=1 Tax=Nocardia tenerifensis TaxID=228006 RepID=A0A318JT58_9NOCA|nr:DUF4254 domain-containing protein [Nocardia tenerifensis]PXX59719.1 uncharacterized protein DUF4254 [Nocardia tenerifensis]
MPTEYAGVRNGTAELPPPAELLRAFRESDDPSRLQHSVLNAARQLVECHERRSKAIDAAHAPDAPEGRVAACSLLVEDIDGDRAELVGRIDAWVADNVEHRGGASLHTETLGAVIDRLAAKWIAAQRALRRSPQRRTYPVQVDGEAHLQWCRLAELTDGYRDLITDVIEHRRRLPVW